MPRFGTSQLFSMTFQSSKKLALGLGVASVAASAGGVAVQAGPALQTLNNITNTAEFTINNTYGQSFSVDGVVDQDTLVFGNASGLQANFNALTAVLQTGFVDSTTEGVQVNLNAVSEVTAKATIATFGASGVLILNTVGTATVATIELNGSTGVQTIGASISSTLYGPSNVKGTSSFTNQLINDLSAF